MSIRYTLLAFLSFLFMTATAWPQSGTAVLNSPDGRLAITFRTVSNDQPAPGGGYAVRFIPLGP